MKVLLLHFGGKISGVVSLYHDDQWNILAHFIRKLSGDHLDTVTRFYASLMGMRDSSSAELLATSVPC